MNRIKASSLLDIPVTEARLHAAIERGKKMQTSDRATSLFYQKAPMALVIGFEDESSISLPLRNYREFMDLTEVERESLTLGFGGRAVCLDSKDLHVAIVGMIAASQPLATMARALTASVNGRQTTPAKAAAARNNGLRGGRPRKPR